MTFANKASQNGTNTLAAEFREGNGEIRELKRTAQNFRIDTTGNDDLSNNGNGSSGSSHKGGSAGAGGVASNLVSFVLRLVNMSGNPLANMTVELHSTPKVTKTNANGIAAFQGVESAPIPCMSKTAMEM